jgi:hypothetical protein
MWALVVVGKKWRRRREAWCGSGKGWGCMTILHSCKHVKVQGMCTQCLCWIPGFWLQIHQHHHQAQNLWVWIAFGFCWSLCRIWIRVCETVALAYSSFMAPPSLSFHTSSPRYTQFFLPLLQIAKHTQTHAHHMQNTFPFPPVAFCDAWSQPQVYDHLHSIFLWIQGFFLCTKFCSGKLMSYALSMTLSHMLRRGMHRSRCTSHLVEEDFCFLICKWNGLMMILITKGMYDHRFVT